MARDYLHESDVRRGLCWVWINTRFPCHRFKRARFKALDGVPRETYRRRCPDCGFRWHVTRTQLALVSNRARADKLEWESADYLKEHGR
jgi:hypothetical protein